MFWLCFEFPVVDYLALTIHIQAYIPHCHNKVVSLDLNLCNYVKKWTIGLWFVCAARSQTLHLSGVVWTAHFQ